MHRLFLRLTPSETQAEILRIKLLIEAAPPHQRMGLDGTVILFLADAQHSCILSKLMFPNLFGEYGTGTKPGFQKTVSRYGENGKRLLWGMETVETVETMC